MLRHRAPAPSVCLSILSILAILALEPASARAESEGVDFMAKLVARSFVQTLLSGEISALLPLCAAEVNFDGLSVKGVEPIEKQLRAINERARQHGLRLTRLQMLSWKEAVQRHGPPPERLGLRGARGELVVALARFNSLGAALILRRVGPLWKIVAITD